MTADRRFQESKPLLPLATHAGDARVRMDAWQIVATPGALAPLERAKQPPTYFLASHASGDWSELEPTDVAENEYSVAHGLRLLSSYKTDAVGGCGSSLKQTGSRPYQTGMRLPDLVFLSG